MDMSGFKLVTNDTFCEVKLSSQMLQMNDNTTENNLAFFPDLKSRKVKVLSTSKSCRQSQSSFVMNVIIRVRISHHKCQIEAKGNNFLIKHYFSIFM